LFSTPDASSELTSVRAFRWASKEAVYKALQPRHSPSWKDISILPASSACPKPTVVFENKLGEERLKAHLSISHDGDYLIAGVLVEQDDRGLKTAEGDARDNGML
jgi:phosphopantetheine--protein transferase-like protein